MPFVWSQGFVRAAGFVLVAAALALGRVSASGLIATAALPSGPVPGPGPIVEYAPVDCMVAERYPLLPACFQPSDQVARARVYFKAEGQASWYFVEMKSSTPCWNGVLPKPSRALIQRHVNYYIESINRGLG